VINIKVTERNGKVVAVKAVRDDDELMLITAKGIMLRTDLSQVREIGRATQGVRLIRPEEGDKVVAVARIARDENEENGQAAGEQPPPASPPDETQDSGRNSADISDEPPASDLGSADPEATQ